jgi:hypothetical protein
MTVAPVGDAAAVAEALACAAVRVTAEASAPGEAFVGAGGLCAGAMETPPGAACVSVAALLVGAAWVESVGVSAAVEDAGATAWQAAKSKMLMNKTKKLR